MTSVLTDFRTQLMTILTDELGDEIAIINYVPDSIAPPAVVFGWSSPWMVFSTWCEFTAIAELVIVAARIEPGMQLGVLEDMVQSVVGIMRSNRIAVRDVTSPYPILLGGVNYLATSVNIVQELGD